MAKRAKPEEIIAKLREVEVRLSQGEGSWNCDLTVELAGEVPSQWALRLGSIRVNHSVQTGCLARDQSSDCELNGASKDMASSLN